MREHLKCDESCGDDFMHTLKTVMRIFDSHFKVVIKALLDILCQKDQYFLPYKIKVLEAYSNNNSKVIQL